MANTDVISTTTLSGFADYDGLALSDVSTPGFITHTASSTASTLDEIWLWVCNVSTADEKFSLEVSVSGAGAVDAVFENTVPSESGLFLACPGWTLGNGAVLRTLAVGAASFTGFGYVNRITTATKRVVLSGSTDGRPINVTTTATPGQTIHTSSSSVDSVSLWCGNTGSVTRELNVEWGETGAGALIQMDVAANSTVQVTDGLRLGASTTITAYESSGADLAIIGHVNRLS